MNTWSLADIERGLLPFRVARRVILRQSLGGLLQMRLLNNPFLLVSRMFVRLKSADSILEKMRRKGIAISHVDDLLHRMPDVLGCRIIVESVDELNDVDRLLRRLFEVRSCSDHVASPTDFGERGREYGLSVEFGGQLFPFEMQARTFLQHYWSMTSFHLLHKQSPDVARQHTEDLWRLSEALEVAEAPAARLAASAASCTATGGPLASVPGLESHVHLVVVEPGEHLADIVVIPLTGDDAQDHERTVEAKLQLYAQHSGSAIVEACCLNLMAFILNEPHVRVPLDRIDKVAT